MATPPPHDPGAAPSSPRVERRRERARQRLVAAARELVAERGVEATTLRDVTARADVGFASLYHHFADKDALVAAVFAEALEAVAAAAIGAATDRDDAAEAVAVAHRWFIRLAHADPPLARLVVQLDGVEALFARQLAHHARPVFERGIADGRLAIDDLDTMLAFTMGGTLGVLRSALAGELDEEVGERSATVLLRAAGVPQAEAREIAARPLPRIDGARAAG